MNMPKPFNRYKNGFLFAFKVEKEDNGLEHLEYELREVIGPHADPLGPLNDYLKSVTVTEENLQSIMKTVDDKINFIREQYHRRLTFNVNWTYFTLNCKVYLDIQKYRYIMLTEDNCIGLRDLDHLNNAADALVEVLFPIAFGKLIDLKDKIDMSDLVVAYVPEKQSMASLYEYMIDEGVSVLHMIKGEELTAEDLRKWVKDTRENYNDPNDDLYFPEEKLTLIDDAAEELIDYIRKDIAGLKEEVTEFMKNDCHPDVKKELGKNYFIGRLSHEGGWIIDEFLMNSTSSEVGFSLFKEEGWTRYNYARSSELHGLFFNHATKRIVRYVEGDLVTVYHVNDERYKKECAQACKFYDEHQ